MAKTEIQKEVTVREWRLTKEAEGTALYRGDDRFNPETLTQAKAEGLISTGLRSMFRQVDVQIKESEAYKLAEIAKKEEANKPTRRQPAPVPAKNKEEEKKEAKKA